MIDYLLYDLRIEQEALFGLDVILIDEIAKRYKSHNLKSLHGVLRRKNA
jgi:hypothetical protein